MQTMNPEPKIKIVRVILRVRKGRHGYSSLRNAALRVSPVVAHQRLLSSFTHTVPFDFQFAWTFLDSDLKRFQSKCKDIRIEVWAKRARRHFIIGYAFLPILESENLHQNAKLFKRRLTLVSKITDEVGIICPEIIVSLTTQTTLPECTFHEVCRKDELYWLKYGPESKADYRSDSSDHLEDVDSADDKKSEINTDDSSDVDDSSDFDDSSDVDDSSDGLEPDLEEKSKASDKQKKPTPDDEIKSLKSDEIPSTIRLLESQDSELLPAPQQTNDSIYDLAIMFEGLLKARVKYLTEKSATNKDEKIKSIKSDKILSTISLLRSQNPQLLPAPQETNDSIDDLTMKFGALFKAQVAKYIEKKPTTNTDVSEDTKETNDSTDDLTMKFEALFKAQVAGKEKSTTNTDNSEDTKEIANTSSGQKYNEASSDSEEDFWGTKTNTKKKRQSKGGKGIERSTERTTTNLTTSIDQSIKKKRTAKAAATLKLNKLVAASSTNLCLSLQPAISIKDTLK